MERRGRKGGGRRGRSASAWEERQDASQVRFGPSTPREPERSERKNGRRRGRRKEGRRKGFWGKKRQQASPRCGFRGTLHAQGAQGERAQETGSKYAD
jgi:hypothetical protein